MPDTVQQRQDVFTEFQLEQCLMARQHQRFTATVDMNFRTGLRRFARTKMRQHATRIEHALDQHLDLAAGILLAEQARRNDAGIVEHHEIARPQVIEQLGKAAMLQSTARAVEHQQTAGTALGQRMTGDQRIG